MAIATLWIVAIGTAESVAQVPKLAIKPKNVYSDNVVSGFLACDFIVTASPAPTTNLPFLITSLSEYTIPANKATHEIQVAGQSGSSECTLELTQHDLKPFSYTVGSPRSAIVYKATASKPGITLAIDETTVYGEDSFTIKVNTTHAPNHADGLDVMVSFTDSGNRLIGTPSMTINIPMDAMEGELTVNTNAKGVENTISVSVENNENYVVHPDVKTDSVTINALTIPIISISQSNNSVTEAEGAFLEYTFTLSHSNNAIESITHSVASEGTTAETSDYSLNAITFNGTTASLSIEIENDGLYEGDETIVIDLTSSNAKFSPGVNTHSLTVTISDDEEMPEISFNAATDPVTEGDSFNLAMVASVLSEAPYTISYTPIDTAGNFLHATSDTSGTSKIVDANFVRNNTSNKWEQTISIGTRAANGMDEKDGEISVILDTPASSAPYTIDTTMKTVKVAVHDFEVPKLSIVNAVDIRAGGIAEFEVTSDIQPHQALSVNYTPINVSANFLDETTGAANASRMSTVAFSAASPFTATIRIQTIIDSAAEEGVIRIALVDDTEDSMSMDYSLPETNFSAFVTVKNESPEIWFGVSTVSAKGTDSMVSLAVKSMFLPPSSNSPANSLAVRYRSTNVVGDFLGSDNNTDLVQTVVFAVDGNGRTASGSLNVNLKRGSGGESEGSFTATLLDDDSDPVTYTVASTGNVATVYVADVAKVSISTAFGDEGGTMVFTVELSTVLAQDLTIGWEVEIGMGNSARAADFTGNVLPSGILTIRSGSTMPETALMVGIFDDTEEELAEIFTVKLSSLALADSSPTVGVVAFAGSGSSETAFGIINANDQSMANEITITAGTGINEGENAIFTIRSSQGASTVVRITVSQRHNHIFMPVPKTATLVNGLSTLRIPTFDNTEDNPDGSITVTLIDGNDYDIPEDMDDRSATVVVRDNDPAGGDADTRYSVAANVISSILLGIPETPSPPAKVPPAISITANSDRIEEGAAAVFTLTASQTMQSNIAIRIKLNQMGDFVIGPMDRSVLMKVEHSAAEFVVKTDDDQLAELDGRITATIQNGSGYLVGSENTAYVAVSDALDIQQRKTRVAGAMHAVIPNLLAHSTAKTFGIATERVEQFFNKNSVTSVGLNGKSPAMTLLQSGGEMLNGRSSDWQSFVDESSFLISLNPDGGESSSATVWGVGDRWNLSGDGIGGQRSWDGETYAGHFGFDARVGRGILTGLAVSASQTNIHYGQDEISRMSFDTFATGIHPYLGFVSGDANSQFQIMAGYGENELELMEEDYSTEILSGRYHAVGFGGRNRLYSNNSFGDAHNLTIDVAGEAWHAQQSMNSVAGAIDNLQVGARHFRIAIEGVHDHYLGTGGTISPSVSVGMWGHGRDEKFASGFDIGSWIRYKSFNGLEIDGSGKTLMSGLNRVYKWEIGSSLNYDFGSDGKGAMFRISPSWHGTGADAEGFVWGSELADVSNGYSASHDGDSMVVEIGYGFEVLEGSVLVTPYSAFNRTEVHGTEFNVGSRLKTDSGMDFELGATRSVTGSGGTGHKYDLTGNINW